MAMSELEKETKRQEEFVLTISAESVVSTDERFTMTNLHLGDKYEPLDAYFKSSNGNIVNRARHKRENKISNQTMPRIAFQIFEKEISALSAEAKENFPVCQYTPEKVMYRGIFASEDEFKKSRNTKNPLYFMKYQCDNNRQFVIYCWNIFSTIIFVQECLKRFGKPGDQFILKYREKREKEKAITEDVLVYKDLFSNPNDYQNPFSNILLESKNLILRGAPGTGKSYLAKKIAADIISDGRVDDYKSLTDEQKKQVEFVQFHPSYDYSDFVEGLRPKINNDGTMGFELQDGIFKKFVMRARGNYENFHKPTEEIAQEMRTQKALEAFFDDVEAGHDEFKTLRGKTFYIKAVDENCIDISIPPDKSTTVLKLRVAKIRLMIESDKSFEKIGDVTSFLGNKTDQREYSYYLPLCNKIKMFKEKIPSEPVEKEECKNYIFIIDEINRGEISKIFGELFFSIDPGYRGKDGEISTQYSNMHSDPDEKFYIPENVYIIGTMNDIDRSVDSFDFAMRRRFRFVELRADECCDMLAELENEELKNEAVKRMSALNKAIAAVEELNENYQIGAAYFLKLKNIDFDRLWTDYLQPLLQEYIRGMYDEEGIMNRFAEAYGYRKPGRGDTNESAQNQG